MDVNIFTQDLKQVFTILQEIKVVEKYVKELIEKVGNIGDIPQEIIEYYNNIKDYVVQNGSTTEIGGNLEVDGNVTINSSNNIITKDGSTLKMSLYKHIVNLKEVSSNDVFQLSYYSTSPNETWKGYINELYNASLNYGSNVSVVVQLLLNIPGPDTSTVYTNYLLRMLSSDGMLSIEYYDSEFSTYNTLTSVTFDMIDELFNEQQHFVIPL